MLMDVSILLDDLNQMHRINNESYRNPVSRHSGQTQSFLMKNENAAGVEARSPLSHQISGSIQSLYATVQKCVLSSLVF